MDRTNGKHLNDQDSILEESVSDFLMHLTNEPILILNPDFTISQANQAFLNTTGRSREQVIGAYCYQTIYGYDSPCSDTHLEYPCPVLGTLRSGESSRVIHEIPTIDGTHTYYNVVSYPIKNHYGEIVNVIEIWQDLTEEFESRMEKRSQQLKDDLNKLIEEDRMMSLGKLAASCVHEINNPIQGILTFSHLIENILAGNELDSGNIKDMKKYASLMSSELERCGRIVSGLLSFARESPGKRKEIVLNDLLESVIMLTKHKMHLQDIRLEMNIGSRSIILQGDANQLQQCLLNIVFNAIEAMPNGGILTIGLTVDDNGKKIIIEIRDTGYGISEEDIPKIFDPFYTTKSEGSGTGLGLSIAYGVVKSHAGNIRVESLLGKGSAFFIEFSLQNQ